MTVALLKIDGELLCRALNLPLDCELVALNGNRDVEVVIDHPSIPAGTISVAAMFIQIHGVTVFDRFLPTGQAKKRPK